MSAPRAATADLNANIVFEGASSSPPWWAMLRKWRSSHGLGSGATALALAVPTASDSTATTPIARIRRPTNGGGYCRPSLQAPVGRLRGRSEALPETAQHASTFRSDALLAGLTGCGPCYKMPRTRGRATGASAETPRVRLRQTKEGI
jgi:hypothetical protein